MFKGRLCRPRSCARLGDGQSNLFKVLWREGEIRRADPAINLLRRASPDDGPCHTGPRERPSYSDRRDCRVVPLGDRPEGITERQIAVEIWLSKLCRAATPVIRGQVGYALGAKAVRQNSGLHRAVYDDARAVRFAPGDLTGAEFPANQRKRRL